MAANPDKGKGQPGGKPGSTQPPGKGTPPPATGKPAAGPPKPQTSPKPPPR